MQESNSNSIFYKRRLPHFYEDSHPVFLTWRLKFSLPEHISQHLKEMKAEHDKQTQNLSEEYIKMQGYTYHKKIFGFMDEKLGLERDLPDFLKQPEIAQIVRESLLFHNDKKYSLHAFCIMPNHVHVLITPFAKKPEFQKTLSLITQNWKRYTARQINTILDRTGSLWSAETYDHLVRNEQEFSRIISYILQNPKRANLVKDWNEWSYSWVADEFRDIMS